MFRKYSLIVDDLITELEIQMLVQALVGSWIHYTLQLCVRVRAMTELLERW